MQAAEPAAERPRLGGRDVDEHGINSGLLRCPRCLSRLVSCRGRLHERQGPDAILWVPHKQSGAADAEAVASAADAPAPEAAWDWTEQQHTWWWSVADMEEVPRCVETLPMRPPRLPSGWLAERLAEAAVSSRHGLPLRAASGEPAGRSLCHLVSRPRSTTAGSRRW